MAIIITDQYRLRQENFLDDRQGLATSTRILRNWDTSTVPIPDGFEVYVSGVWYVYDSNNTFNTRLGKFRSREDVQGITEIRNDISELQFDVSRNETKKFSDLLDSSFWIDSQGIDHSKVGRVVTVTKDGSNNGPWFLADSDYTKESSWVKIISRNDIITTNPEVVQSPYDTNVYSALKSDQIFPKKKKPEEITGSWTFTENTIFSKDITSRGIETENLTVESDEIVKGNSSILGSETIGENLNVSGEITSDTKITTPELNVIQSTSTGDLTVSGDTRLGDTYFGETGSIITEEGKVIATVDKIVAETSDIKDIDDVVERKLGLIGIGNLLKNTSFTGQFNSRVLEETTDLNEESEVYSDKKEDWIISHKEITIVKSPSSVTGYSLYLPVDTQIVQTTTYLTSELDYVISWKQFGNIIVEIDDYDLEIKNIDIPGTSGYDRYYARFKKIGDQPTTVTFRGGPGYVCEIKLEEGIIPTTWFPSLLDTDKTADQIKDFEYLRTAFIENTEDNIISSLFLKNQIKVGEIINDQVEDVYGGLSGVFSDPNDIMFWSGSDYEGAQNLLVKILRNSNYFNNITPSELRNLTKAIITFGSKSIFTDIYAYGKFVGEHRGTFFDSNTGKKINSDHLITGRIPFYTTSATGEDLIFTNGKLPSSENELTVNFKRAFHDIGCELVFNTSGLLKTMNIIGGETIDFKDTPIDLYVPSGVMSNTEENLIIVFNNSGYLTGVSKVLSDYYWY